MSLEPTDNNLAASTPPPNPFHISLDFFSGPMDLLLHLVEQQDVEVGKVSMSLIAEQYLQIVMNSELLDLEKAAEFLVIAATLMSIKSGRLLPANKAEEPSAYDGAGEEFYEELRERLRAYELVKSRAKALIALPQLGVDIFSRNDRKALLPTPEMLAEPEEAMTLGLLFTNLVKRIGGAASQYRIQLGSLSVVSYMMKVVDKLKLHPGQGFKALLSSLATESKNVNSSVNAAMNGRGNKSAPNTPLSQEQIQNFKGRVIGTFVAVLELTKRGLLKPEQSEDCGEIDLELLITEAPVGVFESEFDEPQAERVPPENSRPENSKSNANSPNNVIEFKQFVDKAGTEGEESEEKELSLSRA